MAGSKTLRALSRLLSYPDEQTVEAAELLYIILQDELPEAAKNLSEFGAFVERHEPRELEEAFTQTFDVNPACALEVGWHLFGEEYARGLFLVRMREEMRKYDLSESVELPDHLTHVLAVIAAMPDNEAQRFVHACVGPAVEKMSQTLDDLETPYRHVIACLESVLTHLWGKGSSLNDDSETTRPDMHSIPTGVDLLHAFPVADVTCDSGGCCGGSADPGEFVELDTALPRSAQELQQ